MDQEEDNIPVCDVFQDDREWWSARYTGASGVYVRSAIKGNENKAEKAKPVESAFEGLTVKQIKNIMPFGKGGKTTKAFFNNLLPEDKEEALSEFLEAQARAGETKSRKALFRTLEERQEIGKAISEGQANRSEEKKKAQYDAVSSSLRKFLADQPVEYFIEHGRKTSEGINNMTSDARLAKSKSLKAYRASLSSEELQRLGRGISEGQANMTFSSKKSRSDNQSESLKAYLASLTSEQLDERARNTHKGNKGPNRPEMVLGFYLDRKSPGEWLYNGQCQAGCVIGRKIPDFININGKKAVIELFGNYYHDLEEEVTRVNHFKGFGFSCVIVWEHQVYIEEELDKIFGVGVN